MRRAEEVVVVDFEYASINPRGYDMANHFCEYMADYHCSESHVLHPDRFPGRQERDRFYSGYAAACASEGSPTPSVDDLEAEVMQYVPASHLLWGIWGLLLAATQSNVDFNYEAYATQRLGFFRACVQQ